MTFEEYRAIPALNASFLIDMVRSPAHAVQHRMQNEATPAMAFGSAFHAAVLEPDEFSKKYRELPPMDFRTKAGKETKAALIAASPEAVLLSADDAAQIRSMQFSISKHEIASKLCSGEGEHEFVLQWQQGDVPCKARIDRRKVHNSHYADVCDLKTTSDATFRGFSQSVVKYGYHMQAAWYIEGLKRNNIRCDRFCFICIETVAPFAVAVYELDELLIEIANEEIAKQFEIYKECQKSGKWPAYTDKIQKILCPSWMVNQGEWTGE